MRRMASGLRTTIVARGSGGPRDEPSYARNPIGRSGPSTCSTMVARVMAILRSCSSFGWDSASWGRICTMADQHPVPVAGERRTAPEAIEVTNPYDGSLVGLVPRLGRRDVDDAVQAAAIALREPLAAWE